MVTDRAGATLVRLGVLYGTTSAAIFWFLRWYRESHPGESPILQAVLLAIPLAAGLGYLLGSRHYFQEERLLLRSIERPIFEDGQRVIVIGPIRPMGEFLKSPLGRKDCVAYQYEIDHEVRKADGIRTRLRDYWGMALCPCQVETAAGPVRILGYARLEGHLEVMEGDEAYRTAEAHVRSTRFRHPTSPGERWGSLAEPLSTESDSLRDDICADPSHAGSVSRQENPTDLRKLRLTERCLEVGQAVCAAGCYSAAKRALVPTTEGVKQLRISTDSPQAWAAQNRDWGKTYIGWGIGLTIVGLGCVLAMRWW